MSRLVSVSICLCAFAILPVPQFAGLSWAESAEGECPFQEDEESPEEELVVWSSGRRRVVHRNHGDFSPLHETDYRNQQIGSQCGSPLVIVGHQLANGLCAPLLI